MRELDAARDAACEPLDARTVERALKDAWGRAPAKVLDDFDPEPLAVRAAAQTHRGVADGAPVAIRVRRPGLDRAVRADLALLDALAAPLRTALPKADTRALLRSVREQTLDELDFEHEASTHRRVARVLRDVEGLVVPPVHGELCAEAVFVAEPARRRDARRRRATEGRRRRCPDARRRARCRRARRHRPARRTARPCRRPRRRRDRPARRRAGAAGRPRSRRATRSTRSRRCGPMTRRPSRRPWRPRACCRRCRAGRARARPVRARTAGSGQGEARRGRAARRRRPERRYRAGRVRARPEGRAAPGRPVARACRRPARGHARAPGRHRGLARTRRKFRVRPTLQWTWSTSSASRCPL